MLPKCIQCHDKTIPKKRRTWSPFCSVKCAANWAENNTMDYHWCPKCGEWGEAEICPDTDELKCRQCETEVY